jgi:Domain of unknown function (DUF4334)/GXWXG protein
MASVDVVGAGELLTAIQTGEPVGDEALQRLFDRLDGVDIEFMLGTWRGGVFHYDHPFGQQLQAISWYGKRFRGVDDVEPLLVNAEGGVVESFERFGLARLRELRFRGTVSAAMLYDKRPLIDHFRRVDDDTVIGLADEKGKPATYFFHLTRV